MIKLSTVTYKAYGVVVGQELKCCMLDYHFALAQMQYYKHLGNPYIVELYHTEYLKTPEEEERSDDEE